VLRANPEFKWFLEECVKPRLDQAEADALDLHTTAEERTIACHLRVSLKAIHEWADVEFDDAQRDEKSLANPE
jgi:hypothetical protein